MQSIHCVQCHHLILVKRLCAYSVTKLCPTLCKLIDCSPSGLSVHGISQARILEWIVISSSSSGDLPYPEIEPKSSVSPASPTLTGRFFTTESLGKSKRRLVKMTSLSLLGVLQHSYTTNSIWNFMVKFIYRK